MQTLEEFNIGHGSVEMDSGGGEIALNGIRMGSSCVASWE